MHNIDRTQLEAFYDSESEFEDEMEFEEEYEDEFEDEFEDEYDDEFEDEYEEEFDDEFEGEYDDEFEDEMEFEDEFEDGLSDELVTELATELLEVDSDEEMEQFLGALLPIAKMALPFAAKAVGGLFKGRRRRRRRRIPIYRKRRYPRFPRRRVPHNYTAYVRRFSRTVRGRRLRRDLVYLANWLRRRYNWRVGVWASRRLRFEMETNGHYSEGMELEAAKAFVRFATDAIKKTIMTPKGVPAVPVVKKALKKAASKHAPVLLKKIRRISRKSGLRLPVRSGGGTWARRGRHILVKNAN